MRLKIVLVSLLQLAMLGDSPAQENEIACSGKATAQEGKPDPQPKEPPATIDVGPGQEYEHLSKIDWRSVPAKATVRLHARAEPYRAKVAITQQGVTLEGVPNRSGDKPVISGEDAVTHPGFPFGTALQSVSLLCVSGDDATIKGIVFRDVWESDSFTNSEGTERNYAGGAACIRVHDASDVTIEDCSFTESIHSVFAKGIAKPVKNLVIRHCVMTQIGNQERARDEAVYLETYSALLERVTVKDTRNRGTTILHSRGNRDVIKNCHFEGGGLLYYSDSVSEASSPVLVNGRTPHGTAEIVGGKFISRSASPVFTLRSDIGPDIAIRKLTVDGATIVCIGDKEDRWKRTIGTPTQEEMSITYTDCTFGVLPETEGKAATGLKWLEGLIKGSVHVGKGNSQYIYEKNTPISGSPTTEKPVETHTDQTYQQLVDRFLSP